MDHMRIRVGKSGDYITIGEALQAGDYDDEIIIEIEAGIYREKIHIDKKNVTLLGAGKDRTVIEYGDGAYDTMPDGSKRGTFRSQTLFLGGEKCVLKDLTVRNTAGPGTEAGQALAVYADAGKVYMENVVLEAHQDTLFMAPLPLTERIAGGFLGPGMLKKRKPTQQYYRNCCIKGDVDFIFGGADAVFEDCEIVVRDRNADINGYVTAPSENPGKLGMLFDGCSIHGENDRMAGSVFLGRPWRPTGKAVFLDCRYDDCIHEKRFSEWNEISPPESEACFGEYNPMDMEGRVLDTGARNPWVRLLDGREADSCRKTAGEVIASVMKD